MEKFEEISAKSSIKTKLTAIVVLTLVIITTWYMLDLVLLTFIFTFIFYKLHAVIQKRFHHVLPVRIPDPVVIVVLYVIFAALLTLLAIRLTPVVAAQITELWKILLSFRLDELRDTMDPRLFIFLNQLDFNSYYEQAGVFIAAQATKVGSFGITLFISLILSILLLLEKQKIKRFGRHLEDSRLHDLYSYFIYFGGSFVESFGKVMQVQVTIAFINMILSSIVLAVLGFPQILGLAVMIFALGLIPVAGVIISFIPLSIIAFNIGGILKVVAVIVMIIGIHTIETYILNPNLMATKTKLPVCFVFVILIVCEHYLGVWGLLIGVPIFIFIMDIMGVKYGDS